MDLTRRTALLSSLQRRHWLPIHEPGLAQPSRLHNKTKGHPAGCPLFLLAQRDGPECEVRPPLRIGSWFSGWPWPPPPRFSPPPCTLLTVAQARRSASSSGTPRSL